MASNFKKDSKKFNGVQRSFSGTRITLYSCLIKNIISDINFDHLEKLIRNDSKKFGTVHSIKFLRDKFDNSKQCFINYENEDDACMAINHFKKISFENGLKISVVFSKSEPYSANEDKNGIEKSIYSDKPTKIDALDINLLQSDTNFSESFAIEDLNKLRENGCLAIHVANGKYFINKFRAKINSFKEDDKNIEVKIYIDPNYSDLTFYLVSSNDKLRNELRSLKVYSQEIKAQKEELDQINSRFNEFITFIKPCAIQHDLNDINIHIELDFKKNAIEIYALDEITLNGCLNKARIFFSTRLDSKKQLEFNDDNEYDLAKNVLQNKEFLSKLNLGNARFEFKNPYKLKNQFGVIIGYGSKNDLDGFDNICQIYSVEHNFEIHKKSLNYFLNKLQKFKEKFFKSFSLLKYSEKDFKIYGFDQGQLELFKKEIIEFLQKVDTEILDFNDQTDSWIKAKRITEEYINQTKNVANQNVEISLNENLKKIFIDGTDKEEIGQIRGFILDKMKGLQSKTILIKLKEIIYLKLIEETEFLNNLRKKYVNQLKILINNNGERTIRLTGEGKSVEEAKIEIESHSQILSNAIETIILEIELNEYSYLINNIAEEEKIKNKTKTLIQVKDIEKHGNLRLYGKSFEFIVGEINDVIAEAYIDPAIASSFESGVILANQDHDKSINKNEINSVEVFTTASDILGVRNNDSVFKIVSTSDLSDKEAIEKGIYFSLKKTA